MKKVMITGGAGFIGFHTAKYLVENAYRVDLVDNLYRGVDDYELKELCTNKNVRFIRSDILSKNFGDKFDKDYDLIFHFAAIIGVERVLKYPYNVLHDNVIMLSNILNFASQQRQIKRFVYTSTSEVYAGTLNCGNLTIPTPETTVLTVNDLQQPRTSYMLCKIYGEALCQQRGVSFTIFRPHNIYGPRMGLSHVIPELLQKVYNAGNKDSLVVFSADHTRTFCFIQDAVKMMVLAAESELCENKTFNLGAQSPEITMRDLAKTIMKIVDKKLSLDEQPPTVGSPARRCPDMTKLIRSIGYKAETNLEDGIKMTYDWYLKNIFQENGVSAK